MERATYDRMAAIDGEHWWFRGRRAIVAAAIERWARPEPGARVLEAGCGTGSNLAMLARYGTVDAIEPDDGARAVAVARSGLAVRGGSLPDGVALPAHAYGLVVLLDVLEHIDDDVGTLRRLRGMIAPGGRLLLTVPANPSMWSAHDVAHHHKRRYTVATLCAALVAAGFRLDHMSHFNSLLMPLIAAKRWYDFRRGGGGDDDAMPSRPVNRLLEAVFASERHLATRVSLPFGVSLLAIAEPS